MATLIDGTTPLPDNGDTGWGTILNDAIDAIDGRFTYQSAISIPATKALASGIVGTTLAANVTASSLTTIGTLSSLNVSGATLTNSLTTNTITITGAFISSTSISVGTAAAAGVSFGVNSDVTGATTAYAVYANGEIQSGVTTAAIGVATGLSVEDASFTLTDLIHFRAVQGTKGAGATVTNQYGFYVDSTLTGATNDYGFYGGIAAAANMWNLYMAGTAQNAIAGKTRVGSTVAPANALDVTGSFGRGAPITVTDATATVGDTDNWIICNRAGTVTLTLPAAASWTGREIMVRTIQAQAVASNASNVVPRLGGAAGTAILGATDGGWATLVSDGTNWQIMAGS
jgi:hypothetical protein